MGLLIDRWVMYSFFPTLPYFLSSVLFFKIDFKESLDYFTNEKGLNKLSVFGNAPENGYYFFRVVEKKIIVGMPFEQTLQFFTLFLFLVGVMGFIFNRSHVILALIAGELLILSAFLNFIYASYYLGDPKGYIYSLVLLVIAACEAALGLSLVINLFIVKRGVTLQSITFLRG
jgi:NADH-quinone oxidoreductase subunit K